MIATTIPQQMNEAMASAIGTINTPPHNKPAEDPMLPQIVCLLHMNHTAKAAYPMINAIAIT